MEEQVMASELAAKTVQTYDAKEHFSSSILWQWEAVSVLVMVAGALWVAFVHGPRRRDALSHYAEKSKKRS